MYYEIKTEKTVIPQMPKKPRVRTLMDSQHVKGSKAVLNSERQ